MHCSLDTSDLPLTPSSSRVDHGCTNIYMLSSRYVCFSVLGCHNTNRCPGNRRINTSDDNAPTRPGRDSCVQELEGSSAERAQEISWRVGRPSSTTSSTLKRLCTVSEANMWHVYWCRPRRRRRSGYLAFGQHTCPIMNSYAYMQQGVLRALEEYGIPIDMIGGKETVSLSASTS